MSREMINRSTVVVALDVEEPERLQKITTFVVDTLDGSQFTDTVFEFDFKVSPYTLLEIRERLTNMIDPDNDLIYFWDMDKRRAEAGWAMFRTTVG